MNNKITLATIALLMAAMATPTYAKRNQHGDQNNYSNRHEDDATHVIDRRNQQSRRIEHGIANGELTRGEAHRLFKKQRKIHRLEHRFLADGYLANNERRILHNKRDRIGERIYAYKHNNRTRYNNRHGYRGHHRLSINSRQPRYGFSVYYDRPRFGGHSW